MPVKLCLIGAGHMGRIHAQKLAQMKDVALTCIIDVNRVQAEEIAKKHGVPASDRWNDTLTDGLRGAVIASTTETHYPIARRLLEKGVNVFVEKPIAADPDEARALIELARRNKVILQVGHLERFSPPFRRAVRQIGNPLFIEAHRISGFTGRSTDIDVIHDLMIHDIDLVLSLKNEDIRMITASGTAVLTSKIDVATARIDFADGSVATLTASRVSGTKERLFRMFDGSTYFSLNLGTGKMLSFKNGKNGKREARTYSALRPDPVNDELRAFVRSIRDKKEALVDGRDGLRAILVANRIKAEIERRSTGERAKTVE